jgi:putative effector of murein hydrolase LrgA (UPF0299 family)
MFINFVLYFILFLYFLLFYAISNFLSCDFGINLNSQIITIFLLVLLLLFNAQTKEVQHDARVHMFVFSIYLQENMSYE